MKNLRNAIALLAAATLALVCVPTAKGNVKIVDITRLTNQRTNKLIGIGLVVGLKGSGDGSGSRPAIAALVQMLQKLGNAVDVKDAADASNVALVAVIATIPGNGSREGDRIDCHVMSIGAASSLKGGHLFSTPLTDEAHTGAVYAYASGETEIMDATVPTDALIKGGVTMEVDILMPNVDSTGQFSLIISEPASGWITASIIAKQINDAEGNGTEAIAEAVDSKNVVVTIPKVERAHPDGFLSRVLSLPVPQVDTEARVLINTKEKSVIITGNVEIGPVLISHEGLTISIVNPAPKPTERTPIVTDRNFVALDTKDAGGAKLQDLVNAFNQWRVPVEDRIIILKDLHKIGKLHAKLIIDGEPQ